ncbi:MAG: 1-aminocyclopropane-1-carboxylate deaminase/D-cysteine desulfhydrase [Flavobacterium sp.]|nr:1-aminocyclopropane-1-carboxylate deaminase/D-cysteine desulfhydrase [Flavobacterium sp.]
MEVKIQKIIIPNTAIELFIKREDLIHPFVSGNKFRKLKYNLIQANLENQSTILTFGGAFSNHIAAVAYAGFQNNFKTIGVIRGQELALKTQENPTLKFANQCGMQLEFISREDYTNKDSISFINSLHQKFGQFFLIPEGGTNELAVKGCEEIITDNEKKFEFICCCVGTGGTISGIINSSFNHQKILGFPALKGDFLQKDIRKFASKINWDLISNYHFGGYGKVTSELIEFINKFYIDTKIPLDPIYTGKMVFGVVDLIKRKYFPENSKILIIHSGGIQGVEGMNLKLQSKNLQTINIK